MDHILVTGGAGFIGRHLVAKLTDLGYGVTVVDENIYKGADGFPKGTTLIRHEVENLTHNEWETILSRVDGVFHLAAKKLNTPVSSSQSMVNANVTATWNLAQAVLQSNVKKLVFASSLYSYGQMTLPPMSENQALSPSTLYGLSKKFGENIFEAVLGGSDCTHSVARLFFVYGPGQQASNSYPSVIFRNFRNIAAGIKPSIFGDGTQSLDYVFVEDVIDGLIRLFLDSRSLTVNLGSGEATSILNLTSTMLRVADSDLSHSHLPPDWTEGTHREANIGKALRELGWGPRISLEVGLKKVWDYLKNDQA